MLVSLKKFFTEKGQGLVEYALILAFVAVLAFMMFGDGSTMKSDVSSAFSLAQSRISNAASNASNESQ